MSCNRWLEHNKVSFPYKYFAFILKKIKSADHKGGFHTLPKFLEGLCFFTPKVTMEKAKDKIIFRYKLYNFLFWQLRHLSS